MTSWWQKLRARIPRPSPKPPELPPLQSKTTHQPAKAAQLTSLNEVRDELRRSAGATREVSDRSGLPLPERVALLQALDHLQEAQLALSSGSRTEPKNPAPPPASWRRRVASISAIGIGLAVLIIFGALRIWGVREGVLYGVRPVQLVTAIAVAGLVIAITGWWTRRLMLGRDTVSVSELLTLVGVVVGLISLIGIVLPAVSATTAAPACVGTRTQDVSFVGGAVTIVDGVNGRAQPTLRAKLLARYPAGCLIGFDGFCLGDPVTDSTYVGDKQPRKDLRWLRVARNRNAAQPVRRWLAKTLSGESDRDVFVAAANVQSQTLAALESQSVSCEGGSSFPTDAKLEVVQSDDEQSARLLGTASVPDDLQYVVYVDRDVRGQKRYRQVLADAEHQAVWKAPVTGSTLSDTISVVVAAVPCLAPSIPTPGNVAATVVGELSPSGKFTQRPTAEDPPSGFDVAEAAAAACAAKE